MKDEAKNWIFVSGGARGIGSGLVDGFSDAGYDVVFTYRTAREDGTKIEQRQTPQGRSVIGYQCDMADEASVAKLAQELLGARGAPFAVVNNAGITRDSLLMRMDSADWGAVIRTNLDGVFHLTKAFLPAMTECGDGIVLQISSISGLKGVVGQTNYSATKAAMIGLTRSLALEMARFNIRVNAIAPGFIDTDMLSNLPAAQRKSIEKSVPLRRIGQVKDITSLALFLLSEGASYITGQTFVVDGGLTA